MTQFAHRHTTARKSPPHLEVPVHKPQAVQVCNGKHHLCGVEASELLAEDALPVELKEQMTAVDEIKHQVQLGTRLWRKQND